MTKAKTKRPATLDELLTEALTPPTAPAAKPSTWWELRADALAKSGLETADLTPIYQSQALFTELKDVIGRRNDTDWAAILDDITNLYGLDADVRKALDDAWNGW